MGDAIRRSHIAQLIALAIATVPESGIYRAAGGVKRARNSGGEPQFALDGDLLVPTRKVASGVASNPGASPWRAARATRQGDSQQMNDPAVPIGELIRRERRRAGLSEQQFAARLGAVSGNHSLTQGRISEWENGRRGIGRYWQHWIAVVLDLPPEQLASAALAQRVRALDKLASKLSESEEPKPEG